MTSPPKSHATPPPLPPVGISIRPARLRWVIDDLMSKDGHRITIGFACTAAAIDEPAERQLFTEVFFTSPKSGSQTAMDHFLPALRSTAAELAGKETAEELLGIPARARWVTTLRAAANETAFSCGIEVLAPFEVEVTSPTLQRERLEQMQRIAAERRSADRVGHLTRAAELLKQWESLKASVPSITPGKLLEQVNPADRGLMLDTLLMVSASGQAKNSQPDLWAVSGSYLVRMDVKTDSPQPKLIALPTIVGPLRSIRATGEKLCIGARNGVFVADPTNPESAVPFHHPALSSEFGFTCVTPIGNRLWACHREAGLIAWEIGAPDQPMIVHSPMNLGGEPRNLTDGGLFAIGPKLKRLSSTGEITTAFTANSPIVAILLADQQIIVVSESGSITLLDEPTLGKMSELMTAGRLTGAALLPWLSTSRLLLNRADGPIECLGLEDQLVTRFAGNQTAMRAVIASAARIAAMSNDRQRVVLWNAWDGRTIAAEIYLTGLTHHRLTDLAFG